MKILDTYIVRTDGMSLDISKVHVCTDGKSGGVYFYFLEQGYKMQQITKKHFDGLISNTVN